MPVFSVTGDVDPFLHVSMKQGETIYCESDAMVMMETALDLKGKMTGGLGGAIMRRFANGESFFQQHIEAVRGSGDCLLSPTLPGAIEVVDVGARQYLLNDGAFVAATSGTEMKVRTQSLGNALFAQSGGFFVMETAGTGQVVVSGFGSMFQLDVEPGKDVVIDNSHVVCWDNSLKYEISVTTGGGSGGGGIGGFLGNIVNSVTSGEGIVLRFSGSGKVFICSRNRDAFLKWTASGKAG
ncbi:MAG: TIGR00266 family protein [Burkholderiales bacterium]|uniref:TIGR00266 family protein n=1 Tax=Janthinobacterium tructae TaxID=2590869 RepID=A0A4Y6RK92_9BURK|nr:TIGR00266 family protein [Janthinobacterium tructae]MBH1983868.1 TIGR00266 family protein [Burkholderiales bacterium]MBH1996520.1 TIGR00266 family protein [Burkholderiales bacterium]MBH2071804.1 TIGR00266 family protein [Burkholderiales bacterium]QDG73448.1 TIGR00266 family protein [Janthinobacterium tructae]